jgi:hypothetical protein
MIHAAKLTGAVPVALDVGTALANPASAGLAKADATCTNLRPPQATPAKAALHQQGKSGPDSLEAVRELFTLTNDKMQ